MQINELNRSSENYLANSSIPQKELAAGSLLLIQEASKLLDTMIVKANDVENNVLAEAPNQKRNNAAEPQHRRTYPFEINGHNLPIDLKAVYHQYGVHRVYAPGDIIGNVMDAEDVGSMSILIKYFFDPEDKYDGYDNALDYAACTHKFIMLKFLAKQGYKIPNKSTLTGLFRCAVKNEDAFEAAKYILKKTRFEMHGFNQIASTWHEILISLCRITVLDEAQNKRKLQLIDQFINSMEREGIEKNGIHYDDICVIRNYIFNPTECDLAVLELILRRNSYLMKPKAYLEAVNYVTNLDPKNEEERIRWLKATQLLFDHYAKVNAANPIRELTEPSDQFPLYTIPGNHQPDMQIGFMNGINTSFEDAVLYTNYIRDFTNGNSIELQYNQTHALLTDVLEVLFMNYAGSSPNTSAMLKRTWTKFYEENKDNPEARYLQICHSQGGIHVRNALLECPEEIRKRIIVVNIGAVIVVPNILCYDSYNYVSKRDHISKYAEYLALINPMQRLNRGLLDLISEIRENRKELILLDPDPSDSILGHGFLNPVFRDVIRNHIRDYLSSTEVYT